MGNENSTAMSKKNKVMLGVFYFLAVILALQGDFVGDCLLTAPGDCWPLNPAKSKTHRIAFGLLFGISIVSTAIWLLR